MSKKSFLSRPMLGALLLIGIALALVVLGVVAFPALEVNAWSVNYLHAYAAHSPVSLPAPKQHQRAALWLARDALARADPVQARGLIEEMAMEGDVHALVILGDALAEKGEFSEAVAVWSQVGDFNSLKEAAEAARNDGRSEDARLAYQAAYRLDLEKGTIPLADYLWSLGTEQDRNEAIRLVREALAQYPHLSEGTRLAWYQKLGSYLQQLERWDEAEALYQEEMAEYPQAWQPYIGLGWVYYKRDAALDAAKNAFQQAIAMDPKRGDGYFAMGQLWALEKRYAEAEPWFAKAMELTPEQKWWLLAWTNVVRESGDLTRALSMYTQIVAQYPDWAQVYYEMAWAYQLAGSNDLAIEAVEQALRLVAPPSEWYFYRAGRIYELAEFRMEAVDAYRAALALNPSNLSAQQGLQRLEQK